MQYLSPGKSQETYDVHIFVNSLLIIDLDLFNSPICNDIYIYIYIFDADYVMRV